MRGMRAMRGMRGGSSGKAVSAIPSWAAHAWSRRVQTDHRHLSGRTGNCRSLGRHGGGDGIGLDTGAVARLLERAQCGEHAQALSMAEEVLRAPTGDLADGAAGMHFVRVVALGVVGRTDEALRAVDLMLRAAEREGSPGWRSCALSSRAWQRLMLGEGEGDLEPSGVLQDLVDAETALESAVEDSVIAENAHTGVALGYHQLRLYELALPQYEAAYAVSAQDGRGASNRTMWQCNLATLHLEWALELYRVGQVAEAEEHNVAAGVHAALAADQACGPDSDRWRQHAQLLAGCAAADGLDPAGAARSIERNAAALETRGQRLEVAFCRPFLAVALDRSGEHQRALRVIERAVADLPPDAGWLTTAAVHHTRAILRSEAGDSAAAAALAYGDILATTVWNQRRRTLHTARTMKSYDRLRSEHERVARAAETDSLTAVANRRGFDRAVEAMVGSGDDRRVAVLLLDLDRLKLVNDTQGHVVGDGVLRAVAAVLAGVVRDVDLVARIGGDEFAVLLPGADAVAAQWVARRMVEAIDALDSSVVTVSIGVASGPTSGVLATLRAADSAMYVAKRAGGNRSHRYEPAA
jgi:diguanylate cyclase (GGDEF)-like protein